jgi:uncharacterized protein YbbC (DUF1343 family)
MKMKSLLAAAALGACACAGASAPRAAPAAKTGIDVLESDGFAELAGKRIGLITNHTGKDRRGRSTAEVLAAAPGVELAVLFSPEHGFSGSSEQAAISSSSVKLGGRTIPMRSLYSGGIAGMRPKPEDLRGLDALVFDIQDIGARFYTYLATMGMALEESAKAGVEFVVLDRPDPINGITMEGPVLDDPSLRRVTPTAYFPVPVRHGLTAGEMALFYNAEVKHPRLRVVRLQGWKRAMWYDQTGLPWTPPSPNMPDLEAAALYPGVGIFEAANVSVGRGTPLPFRWIGAPWMDGEGVARLARAAGLAGVKFAAQDYTPSKDVYAGRLCHGVLMRITDRDRLRPLAVFRALNQALLKLQADKLVWRPEEAKRMVGTEQFMRLLERGATPSELERLFDAGAEKFAETRKPYLLY